MAKDIYTVTDLIQALDAWQAAYDAARADDNYDGGWNYWDVVEAADPALIRWAGAKRAMGEVPLWDGTSLELDERRRRWTRTAAELTTYDGGMLRIRSVPLETPAPHDVATLSASLDGVGQVLALLINEGTADSLIIIPSDCQSDPRGLDGRWVDAVTGALVYADGLPEA